MPDRNRKINNWSEHAFELRNSIRTSALSQKFAPVQRQSARHCATECHSAAHHYVIADC